MSKPTNDEKPPAPVLQTSRDEAPTSVAPPAVEDRAKPPEDLKYRDEKPRGMNNPSTQRLTIGRNVHVHLSHCGQVRGPYPAVVTSVGLPDPKEPSIEATLSIGSDAPPAHFQTSERHLGVCRREGIKSKANLTREELESTPDGLYWSWPPLS